MRGFLGEGRKDRWTCVWPGYETLAPGASDLPVTPGCRDSSEGVPEVLRDIGVTWEIQMAA